MLAGLLDNPTYDVVVVGSGAGGMVSAIRAHELGQKSIVIEKSDRYGGTSAVSGSGLWIPNNMFIKDKDSDEAAFDYLKATTKGEVADEMLWRYIRSGQRLVQFLRGIGVEYYLNPNLKYPDYHPDMPGALPEGRALFVKPLDGALLGAEFFNIRETYPEFKLLDRITLDLDEAGGMVMRAPGWKLTLIKHLLRYWLDVPWRLRTHRDRKLGHGNALIGRLRKAMLDRDIPLVLKTRMLRLDTIDGRVKGVMADCDGRQIRIEARKGVIMAAGGYEQSPELRAKYLPSKSQTTWSVTPRGNNTGDALLAALEVSADTAFMDQAWWAPSIAVPSPWSPNMTRNHGIFFERGLPHSLCVNQLGKRFVNEACSYHRFGEAMIADEKATGANMPCWIIFDSRFRKKYPLGGLMPSAVKPDWMLPPNWLATFLHKADTITGLAAKIGVPADALGRTVSRFNEFVDANDDKEFGRGGDFFNLYQGDPFHQPNPCLGSVAKPPFYAARLDLGDLGSKGGPKTDDFARVLGTNGKPIPGLYAVGNCAAPVMGDAYPGAGVTLGTTMTFGFLAASDIGGANDINPI
jgi:3-oxosteroid 1-dehydrogenase